MIGACKMPMSPIKKNFRDEELSAGPGREALRQGLSTSTEGRGLSYTLALQTQEWRGGGSVTSQHGRHKSGLDTCRLPMDGSSPLVLTAKRECKCSIAHDEIPPITRKTKLDTKDGEDGEVVRGKRAWCSSRVPEFGSVHLLWEAHNCLQLQLQGM